MNKKYIFCLLALFVSAMSLQAQNTVMEGKVSNDIRWSFDGNTLTLSTVTTANATMPDYDPKTPAPWNKNNLTYKKVVVGENITNIGSCAFFSATELTDVEIQSSYLENIGWGAFFKCQNLRTFSLPSSVSLINKLAFAMCSKLSAVEIPEDCRVEDMAFVSTTSLSSISVGEKAVLGKDVFSNEIKEDGKVVHVPSNATIIKLPQSVNERNCTQFGLSEEQVKKYYEKYVAPALAENGVVAPVSRDLVCKSMSMELTDLSASTHPRMDINDQYCALVKVMLPTDGATFGGNVMGEVTRDGSEYWVYMTEGSKRLIVKHPDYNKLTIQFAELDIQQLEAKRTYSLILGLPESADAKKQKLTVRVYPAESIVLIDGQMVSLTNGKAVTEVTVGTHSFNVAMKGYIAQKGSIVVMEDTPAKLIIELDEAEESEESAAEEGSGDE